MDPCSYKMMSGLLLTKTERKKLVFNYLSKISYMLNLTIVE